MIDVALAVIALAAAILAVVAVLRYGSQLLVRLADLERLTRQHTGVVDRLCRDRDHVEAELAKLKKGFGDDHIKLQQVRLKLGIRGDE